MALCDPKPNESGSVPSRPRPGQLSALLQDLVRTPRDELGDAWVHALRPGAVIGRFELVREIGRGGFGVVYEALDQQLGRSVAFKTLRPARTSQELSADWIRNEAEAVARLDDPAIVTLYDVGTCDSGPFLVEELLRGETLDVRLRSGPLPAREAVAIALDIARGLAHAHRRGVLHRDLKPANVFLTDDGRVKLLDFGLAHLLGTRGVHGAGTPAYMAPEQLRGEAIDARADVFAGEQVRPARERGALGAEVGERRRGFGERRRGEVAEAREAHHGFTSTARRGSGRGFFFGSLMAFPSPPSQGGGTMSASGQGTAGNFSGPARFCGDLSAARTFSGVTGTSSTRMPSASCTASRGPSETFGDDNAATP